VEKVSLGTDVQLQENCVNEDCEERMFIVAPAPNPEKLMKSLCIPMGARVVDPHDRIAAFFGSKTGWRLVAFS